MANSRQAKKRYIQAEKRNAHNVTLRSRLRTAVKKAEVAIADASQKEGMMPAFRAAMKELHKAVSKGLIKKNAAARKTSRLAARMKKAGAA